MRQLSSMMPGIRDRALFVGQTGSGKTVLAQHMLSAYPFVVVLDPKRRFTAPGFGYETLTTLRAVTRCKKERIIYRPQHEVLYEWQEPDSDIQRFFEWVFRRGNTTLYVDEAYLVTNLAAMPRYYHACLTQGRELGIATWTATQRPMGVPQVLLSEAEHTFAFRLQLPQDRAKVEAVTGLNRELVSQLQKYEFYYSPADGENVGPLQLSLPSQSIEKLSA